MQSFRREQSTTRPAPRFAARSAACAAERPPPTTRTVSFDPKSRSRSARQSFEWTIVGARANCGGTQGVVAAPSAKTTARVLTDASPTATA